MSEKMLVNGNEAVALAALDCPNIICTTDAAEAVRDCMVINTDTWISMGQEAEKGTKEKAFFPYQVNAELLKLAELVNRCFDLRPASIISMLDLRRPIYRQTAAFGHFGRTDIDLPWERIDRVEQLKAEAAPRTEEAQEKVRRRKPYYHNRRRKPKGDGGHAAE